MNINEQIEIVKNECHKLALMIDYDKVRIEYNNNRKINDCGKIDIMPIFSKMN